MAAPDWVVVRDFRHDLPNMHKRCLFELHNGLRFYGERTDSNSIAAYLYRRIYS